MVFEKYSSSVYGKSMLLYSDCVLVALITLFYNRSSCVEQVNLDQSTLHIKDFLFKIFRYGFNVMLLRLFSSP